MTEFSPLPLLGRTVALPENRQLDALAAMLEERGAAVLRCPMVSILDAPDPAPVEAWLAELSAGAFDDLILLTGEGLRRLLGFAQRAGLHASAVAALGRVRKITRGPKPARALTDLGLRPDLAAAVPTTEGVIAAIAQDDLAGHTVGVQLYGAEPNERLVSFLRGAGANPRPVAPYVYAPASDDARVADLVRRLAGGSVDVIAFTSASQVDRLWDVAGKFALAAELSAGLEKTRVAAVGPVVADELARHGARVSIAPAKNFFMKPLVNEIVAAVGK